MTTQELLSLLQENLPWPQGMHDVREVCLADWRQRFVGGEEEFNSTVRQAEAEHRRALASAEANFWATFEG